MYHSVLPEDSVLPRFHHGQHTSHTVAWKCTESTEWAGSTGESRSLHPRANGHTDPPHSAMEQRRGSYTGEERGQVTRLLVKILVESYRVGTNFYENVTCCSAMLQTQRCQPPSEPRELKHWLQVLISWQGSGQGIGGEDSTCMGDTLSKA